MSGDVKAVSDANTLFSSEAVYVNDVRVLEFPSGARLKGEGIEGESGHLAWDLNDNTITGSKGVKVRWFPHGDDPAQQPPAAPGSAGGAQPPGEDGQRDQELLEDALQEGQAIQEHREDMIGENVPSFADSYGR